MVKTILIVLISCAAIMLILFNQHIICWTSFGLSSGSVSCGVHSPSPTPGATTTPQTTVGTDAQNATYTIDGTPVTLVNGVSTVDAAPGSATKITTRYFGNAIVHDFNGDGRPDTAFILTQDTGGSGTFYYAVAALNLPTGYVGSNGFLLGDRIAPQSTNMDQGTTSVGTKRQNVIVFNYAVRKPGENFATSPSVGKSVWLKLDPATMQFGEVAQNFEGEASTSTMSLGMKTWSWVNTTYNNTTTTPKTANKFTLTFSNNGSFSATTDCNNMSGTYTTTGNSLTFSNVASTLMYCEGSQESDFSNMLSAVQSYHFTSKGELIFDLKLNSGTSLFK